MEEIHQLSYVKEGDEAIGHFLTVAAGLDSQIPGDYEIISQIKSAFQLSKEYGRTNGYLERLVNQALRVSKVVRNETSFSNGTLSVSYAVTQQIKKSGIECPTICLLGLGEIGLLTLKNLKAYLPKAEICVVNRSEEKLKNVAVTYGVKTSSIKFLQSSLQACDFVIVCTSAPQPILTPEVLAGSSVKFIFDLSIPQNVASPVYEDNRYVVMDIDSISNEINKTVNGRLAEIPKVKRVVEEKANEFIEGEGKRDFMLLVNSIQEKLNLDTPFSNKTISKTYARHASHYLEDPGKRKEILEALCIDSFQEKIQESAVRKIIASLQPEDYASQPTYYHERKPACFMANQCCHIEGGAPWAQVQYRSR
jgi:glutamyl-tRNA reductase